MQRCSTVCPELTTGCGEQAGSTVVNQSRGAESAAGSGSRGIAITDELVERFVQWLKQQRTGEETIRKYMYYIQRLRGVVLTGKRDLDTVFQRIGFNKASYEAFRRFLTFLLKTLDGYEDLVQKLILGLPKKPKAREDTYVPSDSEVLELGRCLSARGTVYRLVYNILVATGCRGVEARYIVEHARELRWVELGDYVRIHLPPQLQRGSKNEFVVYMPRDLWEQIRRARLGKIPHIDTIEDAFRACGLGLKYLRKWWRQKAKLLGIDSETIEAFQGRVSTVGGRHYTDWIPILDKEYRERLGPELRRYLAL